MKTLLRMFLVAALFFGNYQLVYADEEDNVKEVTTEATYQMGDSDTPAKADEQALLRAKRNALEQVSSLSIPMEKISFLPTSALDVTILNKSRSMNGDKMVSWVQIKAIIHTDKLEEALATPDEYYCESASYPKGSAPSSWSRMWQSKKLTRIDTNESGGVFTSIFNNDTHTTYFIRGNKYFESHEQPITENDVKTTEEELGSDVFNGKTVKKKLTTLSYKDGLVVKLMDFIDPATRFHVKNEFSSNRFDGITINEYRNFKPGPVDPSIFTLPTGYTRVSSMDQLFMGSPSTNTNDPFMQTMDSVAAAATQKVIDNAIGNILGF